MTSMYNKGSNEAIFGGSSAAQRAELHTARDRRHLRVVSFDQLTTEERARLSLDAFGRGPAGVAYSHAVVDVRLSPGRAMECEMNVSNETKPVYFFDSHGGLWEALEGTEGCPEAVAFGPSGVSRPVDARDLFEVGAAETAYASAKRQDLVATAKDIDGMQWELLDVAPARFEVRLEELASEYGISLDERGLDGDDASHKVEIWRDEDGFWHIDGRGYDLLDGEWAPQSNKQAADLWRAVRAGAPSVR